MSDVAELNALPGANLEPVGVGRVGPPRPFTPEEIAARAAFAAEHAGEIREYNEHIARHGLWNEDLRIW